MSHDQDIYMNCKEATVQNSGKVMPSGDYRNFSQYFTSDPLTTPNHIILLAELYVKQTVHSDQLSSISHRS